MASQRHFFTRKFVKSHFFPAGRQRQRDRAKHIRWGRREIRFNLFVRYVRSFWCRDVFAISGCSWQWVEKKWRWLVTQHRAKLVYREGLHIHTACMVSGACTSTNRTQQFSTSRGRDNLWLFRGRKLRSPNSKLKYSWLEVLYTWPKLTQGSERSGWLWHTWLAMTSGTEVSHSQLSNFAFLNTWLLNFYQTRDSTTFLQHVTLHYLMGEFTLKMLTELKFWETRASQECTAVFSCRSSRVFHLPGREKRVPGLDKTFDVVTTMTKLELWVWVCARLQRADVRWKHSSRFLTQHSCHPLNLTNLINWQAQATGSLTIKRPIV